jgi:hypothetical protein
MVLLEPLREIDRAGEKVRGVALLSVVREMPLMTCSTIRGA